VLPIDKPQRIGGVLPDGHAVRTPTWLTPLKRLGPEYPSQLMRFGLFNPSTEFRQLAGPR
jgi:hypothetical protein